MRALERGLAVIRYFTGVESPATISDIARGTGFDRAVVRRILGTLANLGYVEHREGGYRLMPSVLELGYAYLSSDPLPQIVQPRLEALSRHTQESTSFGVLDRDRVVYLARAQIKRIASSSLVVGTVVEPHLTSIGRILLAHLDPEQIEAYLASADLAQITPKTVTSRAEMRSRLAVARERGWCLVDQELELGLLALAVPVRGNDGTLIGAVNITSHTSRTSTDEFVDKLLPAVQDAAATIEADARHAGL